MQRAVNLLRGSVRVKIEGASPESFLNLCAARSIRFWDLKRVDETEYRASMSARSFAKIRPAVGKSLCSVKIVSRRGLPFMAWRIRKRVILIAGLLLVWAALWLSSLFIWSFDVRGNKNVSTEAILSALEDAGVRIGTFCTRLNEEDIRCRVLLEIPELSWLTVNVSGSRAEVIVRERVPKPEMHGGTTPTDVVAAKSGIITELHIFEGRSTLKVGDTVVKGDILAEGKIESLSSGTRYVHAMAEVRARTWYEFSACIPAEYVSNVPTGEKKTRTALIFCGKRLNLYFRYGISGMNCVKITMRKNVSLPGGALGFLGAVTETYQPCETALQALTCAEAESILAPRLYERLARQMDGEILSGTIESREENGLITVTLRAECEEQIAMEREIEGQF